jgi:hypothetical protein
LSGRLDGSGAAVFVEPRDRRTRGDAATAFISLVPVLGSMLGAAILSEVPLITEDAGIVAISRGFLLATGIMSLRSSGKAA